MYQLAAVVPSVMAIALIFGIGYWLTRHNPTDDDDDFWDDPPDI
jgi:hypothetical protein